MRVCEFHLKMFLDLLKVSLYGSLQTYTPFPVAGFWTGLGEKTSGPELTSWDAIGQAVRPDQWWSSNPEVDLRLVFRTGIVGENLRSTSGLELGARTLLAGAHSLTNGEL